MARKITFTEVPSSKGWEPFLKGMAVKDHFMKLHQKKISPPRVGVEYPDKEHIKE